MDSFDYVNDPQRVLIDFSHAHVWTRRRSPRWTPSSATTPATARRSRSPGSTPPAPNCTERSPGRWRQRTDAGQALDASLHIGEVAERVGLSLRTVRYYEEQGLFAPAGRTDGGFRLYTEAEVDRLLLIKQMKPLGFTVQQMRELLAAHDALASR